MQRLQLTPQMFAYLEVEHSRIGRVIFGYTCRYVISPHGPKLRRHSKDSCRFSREIIGPFRLGKLLSRINSTPVRRSDERSPRSKQIRFAYSLVDSIHLSVQSMKSKRWV